MTLALSAAKTEAAKRAVQTLSNADERAWHVCLSRLVEHQVVPLAWCGLVRHGADGNVPESIGATLQQPFHRALVINSVALEALRSVADAASSDGVAVTACKGIVLAPEYYPDLGARPMNDIDLWILPGQREICAKAMRNNGFRRNEGKSGRGADYYENDLGVVFDVHEEMELFSAHRDALLTLTRPASNGRWRVFEPHALLAHLVVHMNSHAMKIGPMLLWMIDLWFVVTKVWPELDPSRLRRLLPSTADWIVLLRTLQMLEQLAGEPSPAVLRPFFADVAPAELEALWRERRLATWKLPGATGWARLAACRLGLRDRRDRFYPSLGDLTQWPFDRRVKRLAFETARRSAATFPA